MLTTLYQAWIRSCDRELAAGRLARADMARGIKRFRDAAILYEDVLEVAPNWAAAHVQCGHMFKEAGDFISAEAHYDRAACLTPNDPDLHLQLGHFYASTRRTAAARASYARALALKPGWDDASERLAGLGAHPADP